MKKLLLILFFLGIWALPVSASLTVWKIAPERSSLNFKVEHCVLSEVEGRFKKFDGTVIADGSNLENGRMEARILVQSIYTGNTDRDKHLIGTEFFSVAQFPEITFKSKSIVKNGEDAYKIFGDLTIHGVTHAIELTGKFIKKTVLSNGKTRMDLAMTGSLNRSDYKLTWNVLLETGKVLIGETVQLNIKIVLLTE